MPLAVRSYCRNGRPLLAKAKGMEGAPPEPSAGYAAGAAIRAPALALVLALRCRDLNLALR